MINRPPEFVIDSENPFKNDPLGRGACAENLTRLVEGSETPVVMTISAPWGHGKTTFIHIWQVYLSNRGFKCIYFNAWENDYADDPLVSFIGALESAVEGEGKDKKAITTAYDKVKKGIASVVKASPKIALNWALRGGLHYITDGDSSASDEIEAVSKIAENLMMAELDKQKSTRHQIIQFKNLLSEFAKTVTGGDKPLVIFIDELDRCRPDYTVELLERIKHLFSVEGVFFVLAVDRDRLGNAAARHIGFSNSNGSDADGYLRRFIDMDFHLPEPDSIKYIQYCAQTTKVSQLASTIISELGHAYGGLADHLRLSLRVQQQVIARLQIVSTAFPDRSIGVFKIMTLYLFLSAYNRKLAEDALNPPFHGMDKVRNILSDNISKNGDRDSVGPARLQEIHDLFKYQKKDGHADDDKLDQQGMFFSTSARYMNTLRMNIWSMMEFGEQFAT